MFTERAEGREGTPVPLHNVDDTSERHRQPEEGTSSGSSAVEDGTWGERDVGGPVNFRAALQDFEEMRRELTTLSKIRTNKSNRSGARQSSIALRKVDSAASRRSRATRATTEPDADLEAQGDEKPDSDEEEDFELGGFLKDGHFEKRDESGSAKKVGVIYKHLTVQGVGATSTFVRTLPHAVIGVRSLNLSRSRSDADYPEHRLLDLIFTEYFLGGFPCQS